MAAWSGLGMNYGHQYPNNPYDMQQVAADLDFLKSAGVTRLRLAYPLWNDSGTAIASCQALVHYALAQGFYVIWGVVAQSPANATQWAAFKDYIMDTLAPWAQGLQNSNFELSIGNEEEFHCDGTTLTIPTVVSDLAALATAVQGVYTHGPISYQASIAHLAQWQSNGRGGLDRIGFNCYSRTPAGAAFQAALILAAFPGSGYVAEWGTGNGRSDFSQESLWTDTIYGQHKAWQASGLPEAYYFAYRDGSFGLPADAWAVKMTNGSFRSVAPWLLGLRPWFLGVPNTPLVRTANVARAGQSVRAASGQRLIF
ncbi:MAG TPA: hypothetical protein VJM32_00970 [Candidatus Saccharimonadales bacterium]|nr:hypothetical protein [Candidatus Saccharimonadales bacterium]